MVGNFEEKELPRAQAIGIPIGILSNFEKKELPRALAIGIPIGMAGNFETSQKNNYKSTW